ncbi:hypothetical protein LTR84_010575 [Exophiala bonariae]|uniref:Enoyl reductase (ER) domain-containing protein n=1 Tax=Exophiala bonariae TaxID=1690606 RepID=A0AAV9MVQ9_9EURO|nr:hypothetical protein LTR84_010575 [Exophiala bonariae]
MPSAWQIADGEAQDWQSIAAIENLHLVHDIPKPVPGPGEVLLNIKAVALNARDMMVVAHNPVYPAIAIPELVPCGDAAGVIEAVGPDSKWKVGDKVLFNPVAWVDGPVKTFEESDGTGAGSHQGTLREYAVFPDSRLIAAPSHLSFVEMASLAAAAGTASHTLFYNRIPFKKGDIVVAQGTGGVSAFVIQLAAAAGATVIATSSSDEKLSTARSLGATHLINYRKTPDWGAEVLRITNGQGADHVVDVAGAGTIEQSILAAKHGGLVSLIGFLTESKKTDLVAPIIIGAKTIYGVLGMSNVMLEKVVELYNEHQLHPPIAKVFKFQEAKDAFAELTRLSAVGKIVVEVGV